MIAGISETSLSFNDVIFDGSLNLDERACFACYQSLKRRLSFVL
jgi:hypothetical protein